MSEYSQSVISDVVLDLRAVQRLRTPTEKVIHRIVLGNSMPSTVSMGYCGERVKRGFGREYHKKRMSMESFNSAP